MGDANPIRTLGDYSKPSHEGYRNTIELPVGNNMVPHRSDTIRLVQSERMDSFQGLTTESPSSWHRSLASSPNLYDHIDQTLKKTLDYAAEGLLRKLSAEKARATIKKLAQYEDEGWNDPVIPEEGSLDYENPDIEHLLGVMEYKVDALMMNAISLMGSSEGEERVEQFEEYMRVIMDDFIQLSSEVTNNEQKTHEHKRTILHLSRNLIGRKDLKIRRDVIDWKFLAHQNLDQAFFKSINTDPFSRPQWANLFRVNKPIYQELVHEFFASFKFEASAYRDVCDSDCMIFWLLTNEMRDALSIEPPPHVFKKKSLIAMSIIMELQNGICVWPTTQAVEEDDEAEEEAEGEAANMRAGGSAKIYRNMSQDDWQVRQAR
ncbi:hypothetical protein Tco_0309451 [Tanacetum coccineum]